MQRFSTNIIRTDSRSDHVSPEEHDSILEAGEYDDIADNAMQEGLDEESGFGPDVNPVYVLRTLRFAIQSEIETVQSATILEHFENKYLDLMKQGVEKSHSVLKSSCYYLMEFVNELEAIKKVMRQTAAIIREKLREEYRPLMKEGKSTY